MFSLQRSFSVRPAALSSGHPYALNSSAPSCDIPFLEYRGVGPPQPTFGEPGDVYVDLTPGMYALYWRDRDHALGTRPGQWERWTALLLDKIPLHRYLIPHPWARSSQSSDVFLWVDPNGITWTSKDNLCASRVLMVQRNVGTPAPGRATSTEALVSDVLHKMLEVENTRRRSQNPDGDNRRSAGITQPPPDASHRPSSRPFFHPSGRSTPASIRTPMGGAGPSHRRLDHPNSPPPPAFAGPSRALSPIYSSPSSPVSTSRGSGPSSSNSPRFMNESPGDRLRRATEEMNKALHAEELMKQRFREKTRELARFKTQEKELMAMSYRHEKREMEFNAAIASAESKSAGELAKIQEALAAVQREGDAVRRELEVSVTRLKCSEEELAGAKKQIEGLRSYLDTLESGNIRLKEDLARAREE
ncbi:hypothetical protein FB45DRAFT_911418 [Roridomyces roridus]|uniref:Uncharacterized protein n=1 Tax=Roridomyces roridus TaxID=1738132 RepID=A0AAD7C0N4_9AGAR|nr:hypothetical protein FB45DRAFT_911418 [Roridomyces roridus]